jgi:hypothetical protein
LEYYENTDNFDGKGEGQNADWTVGTTHLHNDGLLSEVTEIWLSHLEPLKELLRWDTTKTKFQSFVFYVY